jgi:hypothetical protein
MDAHFCQAFQSMILRVGKDCSHTSGFFAKRIASIPCGGVLDLALSDITGMT